jgi:hypothetical protein
MTGIELVLRLMAVAARETEPSIRRAYFAEARILLAEVSREFDRAALSIRALAAEIDRAEASQ